MTLNPNWGGVTEPNTFGTHEYLDFLDQIGSEAYLSANVGSGTPQEAAEWLEYLTTVQPTTLSQRTRRERSSESIQNRLSRYRQRKLGLRRQYVARLLFEPTQNLQPFRQKL